MIQTQAAQYICNSSANITVSKYLISNAFLDLHWVFHAIPASIPGRPTANHGRASGGGSKWRASRCVLAMRDVKGRRLVDSVLHNLRFVAAHSVRMLCKQQLSQKPVGKPSFLRRYSVPYCLRFAVAPYSFTPDPLERPFVGGYNCAHIGMSEFELRLTNSRSRIQTARTN